LNRALILSLAFVILKPDADAQPSITSFSPAAGSPGTIVTISGANFSSTPASNKVYFGAVAATVISSNGSSLKVSVPPGATYKPITVTVNGLTAYSQLAFKMLFSSCTAITTNSFAPPVSFSNGDGDVHSAIGDMDGDGRPDIVFTSYALSVIRNTGSPGSLSFAAQQNFTAGNSPYGIALGDLDGDGKLDVAITNLAVPYTLSVYKNTSTPGSISFAPQIDYPTDRNPYSLAIIDCDLDGRPDILVTDQYSNPGAISIFGNTGIPGTLSFAPRIDFTCDNSPRNLEVGDIDGDGKPEIITANQYSQTISIFKNSGKPGKISYAPQVVIAMPPMSYPESIALGDLNGDNKPDIAVANNNNPGTISILLNSSSVGNLSFATRTDLSAGTNPFRVCMEDIDGDGKTDIAVTNQLTHDIFIFKNTSAGGASFAAPVGYPLEASPRPLSIGDFDGDGKPEFAVGIGEVIILKNKVSEDSCNLGPDLQACPNFSYTLHAGPGFKTYQWQDGSTDSIFVVTTPGRYFVATTNYCGGISRDTVNVSASPEFVNIGNDTLKCSNDTLTLIATAGFISYTWSPDYNISSTSGQTVKVFSNIDTTYKVTAIKNTGCAIDSIKIKVYPATSLNPGNDTSLCNGNSVNLNPGSGFINYLWNTGATSQQINVAATGEYIVSVKDIHRCISKDTFNVISVYQNPTIHLQKETTLCQGSILDAGSVFINYLWQDGSISQTCIVNSIGKYRVAVIDNHQCKGFDSVEIKQLLPSPTDFIIKDTAICEGQTIILKPSVQFSNYSWSTGEVTNQINISSFGTYWLQVSNNSGCKAKEFINVTPKNCKTVYFPNAFTPNKDGLNEIFKATVLGALKNFHLVIYNHFGQKMFETNDRIKGWDGQYKGRDMDIGTFIWYSEYQFNDELLQKRKGVVTLIR
jgi:gliding motility-associated-like protein